MQHVIEKGFVRVDINTPRGDLEAAIHDHRFAGWVESPDIPPWLTQRVHTVLTVMRFVPQPWKSDGRYDTQPGDKAQRQLDRWHEQLQDYTAIRVMVTNKESIIYTFGMVSEADLSKNPDALRTEIGDLRNRHAASHDNGVRSDLQTQFEAKETAFLILTGTPYAHA